VIKITLPKPDLSIFKKEDSDANKDYGFTDFHQITREKGGIFMFYNAENELLFVGKARKIRQRIKKHFEDTVSVMKDHRDEVTKIEICIVDDPMEREIYETYAVNSLKAKYNVDKVFFK